MANKDKIVRFNLIKITTEQFAINKSGWQSWLEPFSSDAGSQLTNTSNIFVQFTTKSGSKDLTPYPGGTLANMVGYDLSSIFNTDFKGNLRTGTWRVGAILP